MASHGKVEASELVSCERVRSTLQDDCSRAVPLHDVLYDRLEQQRLVLSVSYAVP